MIKITHDGIDLYINDYSLTKNVDELGITLECDTDVRFEDPTFHTLIERTAQGLQSDDIKIEINCGGSTETYDGYIEHTQGKFNLKTCAADKRIKFKNPYECIKRLKGNIFESTPDGVKTVQGTFKKITYSDRVTVSYPDDYIPTLDEVLALFNIPPMSELFVEYKRVYIYPLVIFVPDENGINHGWDIPTYGGHEAVIQITYITITSPTQWNSDWLPSSGGGFYYNPALIPFVEWRNGSFVWQMLEAIPDERFYINAEWDGGRHNLYIGKEISNTYYLNEILEAVFDCSGETLVSNFFGINSDGSNPINAAYDYALKYTQELKIVQSFDIIRERAINDSRGESGEFEAKKLILDLNKLFNLILFYDEVTGVLRWEHVTYLNSKGIDFIGNNYVHEFSGELEVNSDSINVEKWQMAGESHTPGFYETEIDYKNYSVNETVNEKITKMTYLLTDLIGMLNNEDYNDNKYAKMFFLLSTSSGEVNGFNSPLAIKNIISNLHTINRPLKSGWLDGVHTVFDGFSMGLTGEVKWFGSISMFRSLNPLNSVIIDGGTFVISELNIEKDVIKFKIKK